MSTTAKRLDIIASIRAQAEDMATALDDAAVKNQRIWSAVNRLRHEAATHERELIHIIDSERRKHADH